MNIQNLITTAHIYIERISEFSQIRSLFNTFREIELLIDETLKSFSTKKTIRFH
ncbi:hypothetical protein BBM0121_09500 [Bifidobacterium breve MCC 0121]|nr:hypothetical protein BBM0121_09500 [Bifidobacterium breve MCC 0121]KOA48250.1 hypothetical protein BBM1340_10190 [Bifidobacterium breve MCC 1340]